MDDNSNYGIRILEDTLVAKEKQLADYNILLASNLEDDDIKEVIAKVTQQIAETKEALEALKIWLDILGTSSYPVIISKRKPIE